LARQSPEYNRTLLQQNTMTNMTLTNMMEVFRTDMNLCSVTKILWRNQPFRFVQLTHRPDIISRSTVSDCHTPRGCETAKLLIFIDAGLDIRHTNLLSITRPLMRRAAEIPSPGPRTPHQKAIRLRLRSPARGLQAPHGKDIWPWMRSPARDLQAHHGDNIYC
jgi:hypothetical protein